jgi:hypothetical protein
MQYRRAKTPGGTYFFTVVAFRRRLFFANRTMLNCCVRRSEPFNRLIPLPLMLLCCCRNTCIVFGRCRPTTMIIQCAGMPLKTISPAIARMPSNYQHHRPKDVNGRKLSGNHATGNTKSGMASISRNIATTYIGTQ